MAEKRVCDGCQKEYWWPGQRWMHDRCQVGVGLQKAPREVSGAGGDKKKVPARDAGIHASSKVGRPRVIGDFKAHRREYMRKYRARHK